MSVDDYVATPKRELWVLERLHASGEWLPMHGGASPHRPSTEALARELQTQFPGGAASKVRVSRYVPHGVIPHE